MLKNGLNDENSICQKIWAYFKRFTRTSSWGFRSHWYLAHATNRVPLPGTRFDRTDAEHGIREKCEENQNGNKRSTKRRRKRFPNPFRLPGTRSVSKFPNGVGGAQSETVTRSGNRAGKIIRYG